MKSPPKSVWTFACSLYRTSQSFLFHKPLGFYSKSVLFIIGFAMLFWWYSDAVRRQWDFAVYYVASIALWNGENPYDPETLKQIAKSIDGVGYEGLPYLYSPLFARVLWPLTHLSYFEASFCWLLIKCVLLEISLFVMLYLLRIEIQSIIFIAIHIAVFFFRPFALDFNAGNIAIFEYSLIVCSLALWRTNRWRSCAFLMLFAGLIKGTLMFFVLYVVHTRNWKLLKALALSTMVFGVILLVDYRPVINYLQFFQTPTWTLMWDEQVQSIYNCSATTVILRTFCETYFAQPIIHFPLLGKILIPIFPIIIFILTANAVNFHQKRQGTSETDNNILTILILCILLLTPRLAGYSLSLTFYPAIYLIYKSFKEKRYISIFMSMLGSTLLLMEPLQIGFHPGHFEPGGFEQLMVDKDFFASLILYFTSFTTCRFYGK